MTAILELINKLLALLFPPKERQTKGQIITKLPELIRRQEERKRLLERMKNEKNNPPPSAS